MALAAPNICKQDSAVKKQYEEKCNVLVGPCFEECRKKVDVKRFYDVSSNNSLIEINLLVYFYDPDHIDLDTES